MKNKIIFAGLLFTSSVLVGSEVIRTSDDLIQFQKKVIQKKSDLEVLNWVMDKQYLIRIQLEKLFRKNPSDENIKKVLEYHDQHTQLILSVFQRNISANL